VNARTSELFAAAVAQARASQFLAADATLDQLLRLDPRDARALAMQGSVRMQLGRPEAALERFDEAIRVAPHVAAVFVNRGTALSELDRVEEALASFERAIALDGALAVAHGNRARMLNTLYRYDEALESADRAIALQPALGNGWAHRGNALYGLERYGDALESYRAALDRATPSDRASRQADIGMTLFAQQRHDEAIAAFDTAIATDPADATPRYRRALARLIRRDFAGGWDDYEWRWRSALFTGKAAGRVTPELRRRLLAHPTPTGFRGRVLVLAEQGIGDEIMFASVLPDLAATGASVTCVVDARFVRLLSHAMPTLDVRPGPELASLDLSGFDQIVTLGSLPHAFRRDAASFPRTSYLAPRPAVAEAWRHRLGPKTTRLRIGLSWRGGGRRTLGAARSLPLAALSPLLARSDCEFVNLQYGEAAAEVDAVNPGLARPITHFPADEIDDFEDLAALTGALDAVVTVQTALAHLTGAIGQRGLVLIPQRPEWRYTTAGPEMPWYGSLELFRQDAGETWAPVIARIGDALDRL